MGLDCPLLVDPELRAYRAAGLRRGRVELLSPRLPLNAMRALRAGYRQTSVQGDPWQLGGVFVIRPERRSPTATRVAKRATMHRSRRSSRRSIRMRPRSRRDPRVAGRVVARPRALATRRSDGGVLLRPHRFPHPRARLPSRRSRRRSLRRALSGHRRELGDRLRDGARAGRSRRRGGAPLSQPRTRRGRRRHASASRRAIARDGGGARRLASSRRCATSRRGSRGSPSTCSSTTRACCRTNASKPRRPRAASRRTSPDRICSRSCCARRSNDRRMHASSGSRRAACTRAPPTRATRTGSGGATTACVAYAETKRAQVVLAELWAERFAGTRRRRELDAPGLGRHAGRALLDSRLPAGGAQDPADPAEGADTVVWLAASERGRAVDGLLLLRPRAAPDPLAPLDEGDRCRPEAALEPCRAQRGRRSPAACASADRVSRPG